MTFIVVRWFVTILLKHFDDSLQLVTLIAFHKRRANTSQKISAFDTKSVSHLAMISVSRLYKYLKKIFDEPKVRANGCTSIFTGRKAERMHKCVHPRKAL